MKFKELLALQELLDMDEPGEIIGRTLILLVGLGLALYALTQGFPWYIALIIVGGFYVMAMEKKVSGAGEATNTCPNCGSSDVHLSSTLMDRTAVKECYECNRMYLVEEE